MRLRSAAGLAVLAGHRLTDPARLAAIGFCFGGTTVLELAMSGAGLQGVVSFHGGLDFSRIEDVSNITGKVLILHGAADPHVPPKQVEAFTAGLVKNGVDWELVSYGGAVHAFSNPAAGGDPSRGAAYDKRAANRSWDSMRDFLESSVGPVSNPFNIRPLLVGSRVPGLTLRTPQGEAFDLVASFKEKPAALIFYRGGWCPFCTRHLKELRQAQPELAKLGYRILAISPDIPENLSATLGQHELGYTLLSDSRLEAARAFGIAFEVDEATQKKYRGYGIELADQVVSLIETTMHTGSPGDGKIYVMPVEQAIRVSTGERGEKAV